MKNSPFGTTKGVTSGQTYKVTNTYALVIDQGIIAGIPTLKDSTVYVQTFEHDIITGKFKLIEKETKHHFLNKFVEYYEVSDGIYEERLVYPTYISTVEEKIKTYWLHDIFSYMNPPDQPTGYEDVYGNNLILFETANTFQTQQVVDEIDALYKTSHFDLNGNLSSVEEFNYQSTSFSPPALKLLFILKILDK